MKIGIYCYFIAELFTILAFIKTCLSLPLLQRFGCYGKNENWHLLLIHCRYFDESFLEMFVEWSSTKHIGPLPNLSIRLVVMATKMLNLQKILKIKLLRSYMGDKGETLQKCS